MERKPSLFQEACASQSRPSRNSSTSPPLTHSSEPILIPKFRNLVCRIPLPTFFYALEAIHLGNLRRFGVRRCVGRTCEQVDPAIFKEHGEMTEQVQNRTRFAEALTHSLRKGFPGMQQPVKKKRRLFSVPTLLCRSLVALPH